MFKIKENDFNTWQEYRKKIEFAFYILFIIPLSLFVYFFLFYNGKIEHKAYMNYPDWINKVIVFLSLILLFLFFNEFRKKRKLINTEQSLKKKLEEYFPIGLKFYTKINVLMFIHGILYGLTASSIYALSLSLGILVLSLEMPSLLKIAGNLKLTKTQVNGMNKGRELNQI